MELLDDTKGEEPEAIITKFLKRFRKQEDKEMKDLKTFGRKIEQTYRDEIILQDTIH